MQLTPIFFSDRFRHLHPDTFARTYFSMASQTSSRIDRIYGSPNLLPLVLGADHALYIA